MTIRCAKCHRPLKAATKSGFGPVCAKRAKPIPTVDRDLFGFDTALAAQSAAARVLVHIESLTGDARIAIRDEAAAARVRRVVVS